VIDVRKKTPSASAMIYSPRKAADLGEVVCAAKNEIGWQTETCVFQLKPKGMRIIEWRGENTLATLSHFPAHCVFRAAKASAAISLFFASLSPRGRGGKGEERGNWRHTF